MLRPPTPQFLCVVNTLLSLLGATISFGVSALAGKGRLDVAHIQNCTLAGGKANSASCTLQMVGGCILYVVFAFTSANSPKWL